MGEGGNFVNNAYAENVRIIEEATNALIILPITKLNQDIFL